jgi:hypothetical protein
LRLISLLAVFCFFSCSRQSGEDIERIAILPGNILITHPGTEWMKTAAPLVFAQDLMTSARLVPLIADTESAAYQVHASKTLEATVEEQNGRIRVQAVIRGLATQRNERVLETERSGEDLISALNAISKSIDPRAVEYSTKNDGALQALAAAVQARDITSQLQDLDRAIQADPSFGAAYLTKIELLARSGGQELAQTIAQAQSHASAFTPLDRLRLREITAQISHAPLDEQVKASTALLQLAPNNLDTLVSLASDRFLQQNAAAGLALLKRALEMSPDARNIQLQMAQGLLETRHFAEAEKIYVSLDADWAVLPNLATCILLEGDRARANSVFSTYVQRLEQLGDPFAALAKAGWLAISGQMREAIVALQTGKFTQPDVKSLALSQVAIWDIAEKDSQAAKQAAAEAGKLARAPIVRLFALAAALIAEGDLPPEQWENRVNTSTLDSGAKQALLGYGFFLFGHFPQAARTWQAILNSSGDTDLRARAMLAASLERAGKSVEASRIRVQPFLPNLTGGDPYAAITFGEMRRLLHLK